MADFESSEPFSRSVSLAQELDDLLANWDHLTKAEQEFALKYANYTERGYRVTKYMMRVRPTLYPKQQLFLSLNDLEAYTGGSGGGGKALSVDTPIPCLDGCRRMGDIKVGHIVLDDRREPCAVLACSDVMLNHECMEVTFSRKGRRSSIVADADHKWGVEVSGGYRVVTTRQLRDLLETKQRVSVRIKGNVIKGGEPELWRLRSVSPHKSVPVKCIAVNSPTRLFLAGNNPVPTHNSDSLLLAALQYVDIPTYSAVIFRATFRNLSKSGAIMDRAKDWLIYDRSDVHWNANDCCFTFPSGAKISFAYMQSQKHADNHRSAEYTAEFYDEVTEIPEGCYRYLFSRLRRNKTGANIPLRVRCASNPGGEFAEWVKDRFIPQEYLNCKDNDYRFNRIWKKGQQCIDCKGTGLLKGNTCFYCAGLGAQLRTFVPSRIQDNPALDEDEYRISLSKMTYVERMQMEHGDWNITAEGGVFRLAWVRNYTTHGDYLKLIRFDEHNRPLAPLTISRRDCTIFVTADTATKEKTTADYSVMATWAFHRPTGSLCLLDVIRKKLDTPDLLPVLSGACLSAKAHFVLIEEASSGVELLQLLRKNNSCIGGIPVMAYRTGSKDKVARSAPAQLRMEAGMIYFPAEEVAWKSECIAELLSFPKSPNDDFVDNVSMAAWYAENHRSIHVASSGDAPLEIKSGPRLGGVMFAGD